jgi:hypothetical protein
MYLQKVLVISKKLLVRGMNLHTKISWIRNFDQRYGSGSFPILIKVFSGLK